MTLSEQGRKKTGSSPLLADSGSSGCNGMFCQYSRGGEKESAGEVAEGERETDRRE